MAWLWNSSQLFHTIIFGFSIIYILKNLLKLIKSIANMNFYFRQEWLDYCYQMSAVLQNKSEHLFLNHLTEK